MRKYEFIETIPVIDKYDVLVMGGGIAGVSAAVAASRFGSNVLLVEKQCNLGGLATGGLITFYLPICDGYGKVVSSGIAQELLYVAIGSKTGKMPGNVSVNNQVFNKDNRFQSYYYPAMFQIELDIYLERNGVDVLFDAFVSMPIMEGQKCSGVIIEKREGRALYSAKAFIDTTGDASVINKAGAHSVISKNPLSGWYYTLSSDGNYDLCTIGADAHAATVFLSDIGEGKSYTGITSEDVTEYVKDVKIMIKEKEKKHIEKGEKIIANLSNLPQIRSIRRIKGVSEINEKSINSICETSVGCVSDWREPGIIYEVPFGILLPQNIDNIITAGRTVSAAGEAYEVLRCIPQCAITGQAAGTAAGLMVLEGVDSFINLKISGLQTILSDSGVMIHY